MYKRVEKIEEENLDWGEKNTHLVENTLGQRENLNVPPLKNKKIKNKKRLFRSISDFEIQKKLSKMFDKNIEFASFIGVLLLPYFVGFSIAYALFYTYADMTIIGFLSLEKDHIIVQLWSVGAYIFVTLGVFWAFAQILKRR
ncbi:MAG: hypothetical protein U9O64_11380 [Campylobacterota bacterium]|nr:hypothetical protein [Campylobacterota bacterium]